MQATLHISGFTAYQHKMEIVFKTIQSQITNLQKEANTWKRGSWNWTVNGEPGAYTTAMAKIDALQRLSIVLRANLKYDLMPEPPVFIDGEE
jgi:hypothetical protein